MKACIQDRLLAEIKQVSIEEAAEIPSFPNVQDPWSKPSRVRETEVLLNLSSLLSDLSLKTASNGLLSSQQWRSETGSFLRQILKGLEAANIRHSPLGIMSTPKPQLCSIRAVHGREGDRYRETPIPRSLAARIQTEHDG